MRAKWWELDMWLLCMSIGNHVWRVQWHHHIWPFKVTQGQMWWCHWTRHTWFPIDIYSNHMSNSHHLALIATQNVFSYLLSSGPNYKKKSKVHRITSKWPWTLKAKGTPYMLKYYPRVPNFTPLSSTIARFPDNWGFSIGYNGEFAIFEKKYR